MNIKIAIVDDNTFLINAVKEKLSFFDDLNFKFSAMDGSDLLNQLEENHNLDLDDLIVRNIIVDQGPTLKRFKARARGRGTRILKRTSHITVVLAEESA